MRLDDVQACLRAGIESRSATVGQFLVLINEQSPNPFLNYAVPVDGAAPTSADIATLVTYFTQRQRLPRLEYVRPAAAVDGPLVDAGFDVAATLTLMALDELVDGPPVPDYAVSLPTDADRLRQAVGVQNAAYGEDAAPDPSGALRTLSAGGCFALAVHRATGEPAGAGVFAGPQLGMVEIAGIGVAPEHRRRGVARLVTEALTAEALRRGHQPFLQVEKDEPFRI
ncbi:MAG TPA: GNAT family N-acetyltransferase, partial [Pseudonocardiaceae bacterium]|nr:GNAT family N-acetyltransferase [Pseudonocardiaceae bacterium]